MKSVNEQIAEFQKKTLETMEPVQSMNLVAAQAFERIARKNYDLMGDLVDYAVEQVKVPTSDANLQDIYEKRVADTKAFAEKVNERAAEYVALAGELGEMMQNDVMQNQSATEKPVAKKAAAKKKTATRKKTAKAK